MFDRLARSWAAPFFLILLCLALFVPGIFSLPPIDRDEARFLQTSRQMHDSGDWVTLRFLDEVRSKKPPGVHWLHQVSVTASGGSWDAQSGYRLTSIIGAITAVLLVWHLGAAMAGPSVGVMAALMLAGSALLAVEARLAKTDAMLLASVCLAFHGLWSVWRGACSDTGQRWAALRFWVGLACAVLVKGPPGVIIIGLATLSLFVVGGDRRWIFRLSPVLGMATIAVLTGPWLWAVEQANPGFLGRSVSEDFLPKVLGVQEGHWGVPGYHLLFLPLTMFPMAGLIALAAPGIWRGHGDPATRFALCWLVVPWVMFELAPTKLPHYILPLLPALCLLAAQHLPEVFSRRQRITVGVFAAAALVFAALPIAMVMVADAPLNFWIVGAVVCPFIAAGLVLDRALPAALLALAVGYGALFSGVVPRAEALTVPQRLSTAIDAYADTGPVAVRGYAEPSLFFLSGRFASAHASFDDLLNAASSGGIAVVGDRDVSRFTSHAKSEGYVVEELERICGMNYSKGMQTCVSLFHADKVGGS